MSMPFPIASYEDFKRLVENPLFHQLLDALSIGVSLTDPTGTVRYFSQSCYHIYGLDPSESVVGKKIDAIFQTGRAGVLNSLQTRRINTVNSISYNGVEGLCRRCPILDDKGNLVCCLSEVIVTTYDNERIEELLHNLQQLKRKVGYFIAQETTGGGLRTFDDLVGDTSVMQALKAMGKRFARSREPVLILGESGTGKELFAQAIHKASPRANGSFISVNCAALPRELAESELFGYVEGAFTGARKGGQKGKFELADKGTIFLDEIGDLDAPDALDVEPLKLGIEDLRGVRAALAVGMVEVIAHEFEPALGDAHEPAGIVAGELVAHLLVILEALVGLVEDFLKHILLAQPVIVIDQLFDQILGGELRLLDDHVAAGHPAEAAPVAGALVDDEHVLHMLPGRQRGPRTRKAAADDQHVRIENKRFRAHG